MESVHKSQVGEVLPYQYEPEVGEKAASMTDQGNSEQERYSASSDDQIDDELEAANAWRLQTLSWCKCGHCTLSTKTIECFCCHEKALEYNEYDALLNQAKALDERCLTKHPDFNNNMLSETVLKMDVCRYLEENWPVDDKDLEKLHKLYRLVAYHRCSRWIFQILGKKERKPFPACVYSKIRVARRSLHTF